MAEVGKLELGKMELLAPLSEGVRPGSDLAANATGQLIGVDAAAQLAQVTVYGSDGVWVPAQPAIYTPGGLVRLTRSPLDGGRIIACEGPLDYVKPIIRGKILAINAAQGTLTVETLGASHALQFNPSTYSVGQYVNVLRDPAGFGVPVFVLGPEGNFAGTDPVAGGGGVTNPGQVENRQIVIGPQWSGTWNGSRWDSWNPNRADYGGRAALYQGQGYGAPSVMSALAVYGDQVVNLAAASIQKMYLTAKRASAGSGTGGSGGPKTAVFRTSPHGGAAPGGGPAGSGASASIGIATGQTVTLELPSSMYEAFRTGAAKGLALVGSDYLNLLGTSDASGMVLTIQYQVIR